MPLAQCPTPNSTSMTPCLTCRCHGLLQKLLHVTLVKGVTIFRKATKATAPCLNCKFELRQLPKRNPCIAIIHSNLRLTLREGSKFIFTLPPFPELHLQ